MPLLVILTNKIKDYTEIYYLDLPWRRQRSYDQLWGIAQETWDFVTPGVLVEVVATIKNRCQAVIDAQGDHKKYQQIAVRYDKAQLNLPENMPNTTADLIHLHYLCLTPE